MTDVDLARIMLTQVDSLGPATNRIEERQRYDARDTERVCRSVLALSARLEKAEARKPPGFVVTCDHAVLCDRGKLRGELNETQRDLCETTLEADRLRGRLEQAEKVVEQMKPFVATLRHHFPPPDSWYADATCKATIEMTVSKWNKLEALRNAITALDAAAGKP